MSNNMSISSIKEHYNNLCTKAKEWSAAYYEQDAPVVTDEEYDSVMHEIRDIEAAHPEFVTADSPTQVVGGKRVLGIPVEHRVPMLSLLDVFSDDEVRSFVDSVKAEYSDVTFSVERKIDGLSLSLVYERSDDGLAYLTQASTRGDGHVGEDVTANVATLTCLPRSIELPKGIGKIELRGECYMSEKDFEAANAKQAEAGKKLFANPRNCAAGSLRQADPSIARERNLQVFVFNVQSVNNGDAAQFSPYHCDQLNYLRDICGFKTTYYAHCNDIDSILAAIHDIEEKRYDIDYPIDGAVIKVDELSIRQKMGERTKTPKWAIAYKYPAEEKGTVLRNIQLQTGRTGRITPVAVFDPIQLAGTRVERATLNNANFIKTLDIRIGDTILLHKSGDIIPKITMVELEKRPTDAVPYDMAKQVCPVCGAPIAPVNGSVDLYCTNDACPAKTVNRVIHFASKPCMDIKGLGPQMIQDLVDSRFIENPVDLYWLYEEEGELTNMYGAKIAKKVLAAIEKSKEQNADRVLKGLGYRLIGGHVARALFTQCKATNGNLLTLSTLNVDTIKEYNIPGFSDAIYAALDAMLSSTEFTQEVNTLHSLFLAQKDVIREQLLESLAAMLNPIPTHYEWRSNDCPYDYSGELYEDGKVSLEQTVSEFLESKYTGASRATYVSHYGLSYNTYGDSLSDDTLEIGCSIMTDGIKDFVQRNAGIPCERFSREEFFDIKTECNEFDPIYDECRASDFFWATAAVEFAGIDKMTLKEVLAAV